jgi:hypothetical protein
MKPIKKTSHLFYDKYVNKIAIYTPLANDFRTKELDKLKINFDQYSRLLENSKNGFIEIGNWNKKRISVGDVITGFKLLNLLDEEEDFSVRVEGKILGIYSNNDDLIEQIRNIDHSVVREITKPANQTIKSFLLSNPNKIISKNYTHKFRVTVNPLRNNSENFHDWAEKIPKIKLLKRTYKTEGYFYAADEKVLGLCRLFLGSKIRRIDEMVTEEEICG